MEHGERRVMERSEMLEETGELSGMTGGDWYQSFLLCLCQHLSLRHINSDVAKTSGTRHLPVPNVLQRTLPEETSDLARELTKDPYDFAFTGITGKYNVTGGDCHFYFACVIHLSLRHP